MSDENEQHDTVQDEREPLAPNEIYLAEGTEYERKIALSIPRGKQYRDKHRRLLATFAELETAAASLSGNGANRIKPIVEAIDKLFGAKDFEDVMLPFALRMENEADKEYLDMLTPMEKFAGYMAAASFIVSGGNTDQVRAALKK